MRRSFLVRSLVLTAVLFDAGFMACAQEIDNVCPAMAVGAMLYNSGNGAAYSATVVTVHDQKLADGNSIHTTGTTHQATDSSGRTRSELSGGCARSPDGKAIPIVRITVSDPVTHTMMSWSEGGSDPKIVRLYHLPQLTIPPKPPQQESKTTLQVPRRQRAEEGFHTESLGSKQMVGLESQGERSARTIPAGQWGNALPLVVTDEIWIAKGLGLAMLRVTDDPVRGRNSVEVTELKVSDPDPAMFTPPADYQIQETHTTTVSNPQ